MRKIYLLLFTICLMQLCRAQHVGAYGNEWIDYTPGHQYWKIKIKTDGFYHIPYTTLNNNIANLNAINPNDLVLYHNGEKVYIDVHTTAGAWDSTSYIDFYGRQNRGDMDSLLYPQPGLQPHTYYSLFNDTSIYYLTTATGGNNYHFSFVNSDTAAISSLTEDIYFWFTYPFYYGRTSGAPGSGVATQGTPYVNGDYLYKAIYDQDEAWGGGWINYGNSQPNGQGPVPMYSPGVYLPGPPAVFKGILFTRSYELHDFTIKFNGNVVNDFNFNNLSGGFSRHEWADTFPLSSLVATNQTYFTENVLSTSQKENLLVYMSLSYPRKYDFGGSIAAQYQWTLLPGTGQRYFRISNVPTTTVQPYVYDLTNGLIIKNTDPPATLPKKFVIPAAAGKRELLFRTGTSSSYTVIAKMDTFTFQDYRQAQSSYMIITSKVLRKDSIGGDPVKAYADYRSSKYTTVVYDIDAILDQFGYGVRKTPLAIRNFIEYAYDHWTPKPEYLFIIGKGRDYYDARGASYAYDHNLVPPFGDNPSDNLLTCRRGSSRPLLAVGRLAAQTPTDVSNYLAKVRQYEGLQNTFGDPHQNKAEKLWMKQVMHFSGGTSIQEQDQFKAYLGDYENIARDTSWGANVFTIYKTTSAPVDNTQAEIIRQHIDSGAALMTFFGHASGSAFDIIVDNPATWTNYEKYPIIYSNGCQSGDISNIGSTAIPPTPTFSELSVLTPGKCAVAFTATSSLSTSDGLYSYGLSTYSSVCQHAYDRPWGKALQQAQITQDSLYSGDDFAMMVAYDMTLHGDPALILDQYPKPDYQVDQASLYFNPQTVDANMDSFNVNVIVANLGKAIHDSIRVTLTRVYPDPNNPGASPRTHIYQWKVKAPYYIDTVSIKIATFDTLNQGYGQNQFTVFVESEQRIAELSETNNGTTLSPFSLQILSEDILPIYPYEFAIVPSQNVTLKASTVNPFAPLKNYRIQIDTTETFRHPMAQSSIYQTGGVLHWTVPFQFRDSTVYYWRVSRDSINDTTSYRWHYSSFVYIKNEYPGWNQSHYYQYGHDKYDDNIYLDKDRIFKFVPNVLDVHVATGVVTAVQPGAPMTAAQLEWDIHGVQQHDYRMGGCGNSGSVNFANPAGIGGFTFAVIDTVTGLPWVSNQVGLTGYGQFGDINCKTDPQNAFDFNINTPSMIASIMHFLDTIPSGSPVILYSNNRPDWVNLDTTLMNKLIAMGATGLRTLKSGAHPPAPYVFFTIKGKTSASSQVIGQDYTVVTHAYHNFGVLWNKGSYTSPLIGPSLDWGSFHWRFRQREARSDDQQSVDVIGISNNGLPTVLLNTTALDTTINFISASQFRYIRLRLHSQDDTTHTPAQLYYWRVLYKKVPEAAINPAAHFVVSRDTVGLGDSLNVEVALENVTELPMDSIRTQYSLTNQTTHLSIPPVIVKSDSLRAFQTQILKFRQRMNNNGLTGRDRLTIEANPLDALYQQEQYHFNNYAFVDFTTISDKVNPLLDVTFDGRRIMNSDLVSAKPDILITMKDENKFLALNDTSLSQVYIRYPGQTVPTLINYDNNILTFYPATGNIAKNNQARIAFRPTFTADGTYDLLIRDQDRSGNFSSSSASGKYQGTTVNGVYYDYKISFNVITKSMITNVLNYPNPFTTRTQFVFTLTGSEIPDYMKIQIMTITGKVVKEIQRAELGNIHIGVNKTDYYWDGRDEYGDKLANGVYFYRVITKIDDKNVDHMSTSGQYGSQFFDNTNFDKYFKHGFGKLVIMR